MEKETNGFYRALENSQQGFTEFEIPKTSLERLSGGSFSKKKPSVNSVLPHLYPGCCFFQIKESSANDDIMAIEKLHRQKVPHVKIALLYCKDGQTDPMDMFRNSMEDVSEAYKEFAQLVGVPTVWEANHPLANVWNKKEIIWYPSTQLTADEQRSYIANTSVVVVFKDGKEPLNISEMHKMGKLSLVFLVVTPDSSMPGYFRLSLFHKNGLKVVQPMLPSNWLFPSNPSLRDYLLTKLHNAYMMLRTVPPLNFMFMKPRHATIKQVVVRYASKQWLKSINYDGVF
eukprot:TRINITY_DN22541_c0_g1_i1.p1 TRINITY_DN22541_c0_g1~~TRINITY_DN22541_c0_g1_i1.p1  ORF type:complete len:286 (+),score=58.20 TRINITY_DN22541_c0_g1_i1:159-1016(+)